MYNNSTETALLTGPIWPHQQLVSTNEAIEDEFSPVGEVTGAENVLEIDEVVWTELLEELLMLLEVPGRH